MRRSSTTIATRGLVSCCLRDMGRGAHRPSRQGIPHRQLFARKRGHEREGSGKSPCNRRRISSFLARSMEADRSEVMKSKGPSAKNPQLRAKFARYDAKADAIVIELKNRATIGIPRVRLRALRRATPRQISRIEIIGRGADLFWPELDDGVELAWIVDQVLKGRASA